EELVADLFKRLASGAGVTLKNGENIGGWMRVVIARMAYKRLEKVSERHHHSAVSLQDVGEVMDDATASEMGVADSIESVRSCLQRLNDLQLRIVQLKVFDGLTFEEISAMLGLP